MVALDQHRAADAAGFDDVGIQRALGQELGRGGLGLLLEHFHEEPPDDLALLLRIADVRQGAQKLSGGVHPAHVQVEGGEGFLHAVHLVLAHQPGVHEDAGELPADGLVEEQGGHARIHAAREAQDHRALADLFLDVLDLLLDELSGVPVELHPADVEEIQEDLVPVGRVRDLRMELDAEAALGQILHGGHGHARRIRRDEVALGGLLDMVAVAHPDHQLPLQALEDDAVRVRHPDGGLPVFALGGAVELSAQIPGQELLAVADPQDGHAQLEDGRIQVRGPGFQDGIGPAGEDHAAEVGARDVLGLGLRSVDQAERTQLPQPPRDEPRVLGTEIQDGDAFVVQGFLLRR